MIEDQNDSENTEPVYEAVQPDGPTPMEGVITVADGTAAAEAATPGLELGEEDNKGSYTWVIENFSQLTTQKETSPKFEIGTHFWRLLVFPHGNNAHPNFLSVYLEFTEASFTPLFMCPQASFKLSLLNLKDHSLSVHKDTQHRFTQNETDWGFTQFHSLAEVNDPARGFLMNDTLTIKVEITVQRDERFSYDSRKQTGCVGLKNQGATCYMNSLLQFLYHIPYFRKAVYHMPTQETDDAASSIPLALQGLFYKLQYSKSSVSTKNLTKSFGWNQHDAFMQHDVQEFNRVLCDKLEEKMKGTKVERAINELFEGHIYNFIKCVNVDYKSSRKESFMDLQLDVKGCPDIYASFDKYTETETLEGANQYKAEGFGLQDAEKGALFESFPPVLQLQLKRFEYDFQRDALVKINDRYEFYEEIDLDRDDHKYLAPTADRSMRNKYRLHSVLVHSGGVHGGHYYAFIRPVIDGGWLKFDDEKVTREDASKAMTEQFGGDSDDTNPPAGAGFNNTPALKFTKYSNAYMLVYVRLCDWDRVMCPVTKDDIADHLHTRLDLELSDKEQRHKDKQEAHLYCRIKVTSDDHIREQVGRSRHFDLVDSEKVLSLRLKKQTKLSAFKAMIAEQLGVPVEQQRYWTWQKRSNGTYRPHSLLPRQDEDVDLMDLREYREKGVSATNKAALMDIRLYLETFTSLPPPDTSSKILVFLKYYDPVNEQLSFLGHAFLGMHGRVSELNDTVILLAGLHPSRAPDLVAFEEVKLEPSVMVEPLALDATPVLFEGLSGDIIIFQLRPPTDTPVRHPTVPEFLKYIHTRRTVELRKLEAFTEEGFKLELRSDMKYDEVTERVAEHLGVANSQLIRLTPHNHYVRHPQRTAIRYRGVDSLDAMLQHNSHINELLYYEVVDLPLPQLEQLKTIKLAFYNEHVEAVSQHTLRVPLDKTVGDLLAQLQTQLPAEHQGKQLRLLEVMNSRIFKVLPADESVNSINDSYWAYRAEEGQYVDASGAAAEEGGRFVQVLHVKPSPAGREGAPLMGSPFGDPFLFRLTEEHTPASLRAEVQAKLNVPEEEFKKWRVVLSHRNQPAEPFEDDHELIHPRFEKASALDQLYIGLEHEDRGPKRPSLAAANRATYERPVKIYN